MTTQSKRQTNNANDADKPVYHSHYFNGHTYVYIREAEEVLLDGKKPFYAFKGAMKTGKADDKQSAMLEGYLSETAWKFVKPFKSQLDAGAISLGVDVEGLRLNGVKAFLSKEGEAVPVLKTDIFKIKGILPFERKLKVVPKANDASSENHIDDFDDDIPF